VCPARAERRTIAAQRRVHLPKRASTCHQGYGPATYSDCAVSFERYSSLIRGERVRGHDAKMLGSLYRNNDAKTCSSAELFCLFSHWPRESAKNTTAPPLSADVLKAVSCRR